MAAALLCGIGNVCAVAFRILIEEQHAKIEPAITTVSVTNASKNPVTRAGFAFVRP